MKVAVLGLGEAGQVFAQAYAEAGWEVSGFDPANPQISERVERAASVGSAVAGADLVLSLTTAAHAETAAQQAVEALGESALYVDLNAGSPALKGVLGRVIGVTRFVDGAVIGSVRQFGSAVTILLAGPAAAAAAEQLREVGSVTEVVGHQAGDASGRKLLRSVFMKGLGALVSESMLAAEAAGEDSWMRAQIAGALAGGEAALDRLYSGTRAHAKRRAQELADSLDLLGELGDQWPMTQAARSRHLGFARGGVRDLADELARVPTSALGDGGDRLGFAHAAIKPVWPSAPLAGPAFTVQVSPGDNKAVHAALRRARPGDVLVVAGGGFTERALMGELIAGKAQKAGIRGFITDGAVRDVSALHSLRFPVWAAAVSPAGPFKHGPGRLGEVISLGGMVCAPGDYVVADADGVVVVPAIKAEEVLTAGMEVLADEEERKRRIRSAE